MHTLFPQSKMAQDTFDNIALVNERDDAHLTGACRVMAAIKSPGVKISILISWTDLIHWSQNWGVLLDGAKNLDFRINFRKISLEKEPLGHSSRLF